MRFYLPLWDLMRPVAQALGLVGEPTVPSPKKPRAKLTKPRRMPARELEVGLLATEFGGAGVKPRRVSKSPLNVAGKGGVLTATAKPRALGVVAESIKGRRARKPSKQEHYDAIVAQMLLKYNIKVRKWRKGMSGVATLIRYHDGRTANYLESPRPRTPMSMAIFLHEVGHHAIGLGIHKPRCLEEFLAWQFALAAMKDHEVQVTERVERRVKRSLEYAVGKAVRRGIKSVPPEMMAYYRPQ